MSASNQPTEAAESHQKDDADSYQQKQWNPTANPQEAVTNTVTYYPKQPACHGATSNVDSSSQKDGITLLTLGVQKTPVSKSAKRKAKQTSAITTTTVDETAAASSGYQKDNTVLHFQQQQHAAVSEKAVSKSNSILQLMLRYWFKMHKSTPAALEARWSYVL